jgi:hypothetical protein
MAKTCLFVNTMNCTVDNTRFSFLSKTWGPGSILFLPQLGKFRLDFICIGKYLAVNNEIFTHGYWKNRKMFAHMCTLQAHILYCTYAAGMINHNPTCDLHFFIDEKKKCSKNSEVRSC